MWNCWRLRSEVAALKAENAVVKAMNERLMKLIPADRLLEVRAENGESEAQLELGEKLLAGEPDRRRDLLRRCGLPRAHELLAVPRIFAGSMAEPWEARLKEWRPGLKGARLLARGWR
jgi:hypothetical protein